MADTPVPTKLEQLAGLDELKLVSVLRISQHQTDSVQQLLNDALDEVVVLFESRFGYIYYYSEETREFTLHAWSRDVMDSCSIPNPPTLYHLDQTGIWGEVVRQRRPVMVNDFQAPHPLKKGYPEGHAPLTRFLSVPVIIEEKIVAVVGVANKASDYTESDIRQLTLFMGSVWSIVKRKQAEDDLYINNAKLLTLFSLSQMSDEPDGMIGEFALESAIQLTGSEFGGIFLLNADESRLSLLSWSKQVMDRCAMDDTSISIKTEELGLLARAIHRREATIFNDYDAPDQDKHGYPAGHLPITRFVNVPVIDDGRVVLCAAFANKETGYTDQDVQLIHLIMHALWRIIQKKRSDETIRRMNEDLEQRVAERTEELRESRQQLANIIDFLPDATFALDNDMQVIIWNRAMEEMTGVSKADMLGQGDHAYAVPFYGERRKQLLDLFTVADEELEAKYQQVTRKGETLYAEVFAHALHGGRGAHLWVSGTPLYSTGNKRVGAIEVIRDISERKKVEEELQQAKLAAEAANRAKSVFLANMSHEIRTPMNAITGMAYLALQTGLDPRQREYVARIRDAADSLLGIINDILDFSKIEAGRMELESVRFDLNEVFSSVSSLTAARAEEKNLEVLFCKPSGIPSSLIGDPLRLGQILNNLVGNAIKFTEKGKIVVTVAPCRVTDQPDRIALTFSVADTGIGMDHDHLDRIFTPFTQADSSITRRFGGTGLGLSIVSRFLELMGSGLEVVSEPGRGSTFSFAIEFKLPPDEAQQSMETPEDLRDMKILVVDDSPDAGSMLESMLTELMFRPVLVESGEAALRELARAASLPGETPYRLVLMDWRMPGMDGLETARRIRRELRLSPPPEIIIMSGYLASTIQEEAQEIGIRTILAKPFQMSALFNVIMETFEKEPPRQAGHEHQCRAMNDSVKQVDGIRVLLAEDNKINQVVAREMLKRFGAEVVTANNGREALEAVVGGMDFDMVFMDIQMPEMDGYQAATAIRQIKGDLELPIIAMTAHAFDEQREHCQAAGMNDHVAKPIDPDQLYSAMLRWTRSGKVFGASSRLESAQDEKPGVFPEYLTGIDVSSILERCGGNGALAKEIIISFRDHYRNAPAEIRNAIARGDSERVRFLIHKVKGLSGTIGATALPGTMEALETALQGSAPEGCAALLAVMEQQVTEIVKSADMLEALRVDADPDETAMPLPEDELAQLLKALHHSLRENDLGAARLFEQLRNQIRSPAREEIGKHIARLDFDKAMTALEQAARSLGFELPGSGHVQG